MAVFNIRKTYETYRIPVVVSLTLVVAFLVLSIVMSSYNENKAIERTKKKAKSEISGLYGRGQYGDAIDKLQAYLKKNPDDNEARAALASCYIATAKVPEAYAETKKVYKHDKDPDIAYQLAILADKLGNGTESIEYLKASIKEDPTNLTFRTALADLYLKHEKYDEASDELTAILKLTPKNSPQREEVQAKLSTAQSKHKK